MISMDRPMDVETRQDVKKRSRGRYGLKIRLFVSGIVVEFIDICILYSIYIYMNFTVCICIYSYIFFICILKCRFSCFNILHITYRGNLPWLFPNRRLMMNSVQTFKPPTPSDVILC